MQEIPTFRIDQIPDTPDWQFSPLYKEDINGNTRFWQVSLENGYLCTKHGVADGKIQKDCTEVILNTTGRDLQQQGLLEARQKYKLKIKEGYTVPSSDIPPKKTPMKGNYYKEGMIKDRLVFVQFKIDGVRMLAVLENGEVVMSSYKHTVFNSVNHLKPEILELLAYLPKNTVLDGELYCFGMKINRIVSAVKSEKKKNPDVLKIQYWLFDIITEEPLPYEERYTMLVNAYHRVMEDRNPQGTLSVDFLPQFLRIVPVEVASNHQEIVALQNKAVQEGYEGIMVKKISINFEKGSKEYKESLYKHGRSNNILKYKDFFDEEGTIINIEEASGKEKGLAMLLIKDQRGNTFPLRFGTYEERKLWFQNPKLILGKELTFKYKDLSEYGVPQHAVGVVIRDYE